MGFIDLFHCVKWGLALSPTSVCRLCLTEVQCSWVKSSPLFVSFHLPGINLCLLGKPEIVSHEGPVDGQVRCVAEGFPAPRITWYYCEQPYARWGLFSRPPKAVFCVNYTRWHRNMHNLGFSEMAVIALFVFAARLLSMKSGQIKPHPQAPQCVFEC